MKPSPGMIGLAACLACSALQADVIKHIDLADIDQDIPHVIGVNNGDRIGWHGLSSAGDFNGDGNTDLMIGSFYSGIGGRVWLFFDVADRIELFDGPIDTSQADLLIEASNAHDSFGAHLGNIGDINGDGCDDIAIGASGGDPLDRDTAGYISVIYGCNPATLAAGVLYTDDIDGSNGFTIMGAESGDRIGHGDVVGLGDFNGDGLDDFAFGTLATGGRIGSVFVLYGQDGNFPAQIDLADTDVAISRFDGSQNHPQGAQDFGLAVAALGDFNGNGYTDLIAGANGSNHGEGTAMWSAGAAYVIFGQATPPTQMSIDALDGSNGFAILSGQSGAWLGYAVTGGRDINGNGLPDLAVGALADSPMIEGETRASAGSVFLIYGREDTWPASINAHELTASEGMHIVGPEPSSRTGGAIAMSGTVDDEGVADLVIGAYQASPQEREKAGQVYVIKGQSTPLPSQLDLAAISGVDAWRIDGAMDAAWLGISTTVTPDLNGDGAPQLLLGANLASSSTSDRGQVLIMSLDAIENPVVEFDLVLSIQGEGTVSSDTGEIACPGSCDAQKPADSQILLSADPAPGWSFDGWAHAACDHTAGIGTCGLVMDQSHSLQASFSRLVHTVSVNSSGPGTVSPSSLSVEHGMSAIFQLRPGHGAGVSSASGCAGQRVGLDYTTGPITQPCSIAVSFEQRPEPIFADRFTPR